MSVVLPSCARKPWHPPPHYVAAIEPIGELPTYLDLVHRYNANLVKLDRLWARADVTLDYRDEKRKRHIERGIDSFLITIPPDHVALQLGGAFTKVFWVGCDEIGYWCFDLRDEKSVYYGLRSNLGKQQTEPLPVPIYPQDIPKILGLIPIDPQVLPTEPAVEWHQGYWLIEPPNTGVRMVINPTTALPVRIDVVDTSGRSVLAARLHDPKPIKVKSEMGAMHDAVRIATRIDVWLLYQDIKMSIRLKDATDGRGISTKDKSFSKVFNFKYLLKVYQPGHFDDLDSGQIR